MKIIVDSVTIEIDGELEDIQVEGKTVRIKPKKNIDLIPFIPYYPPSHIPYYPPYKDPFSVPMTGDYPLPGTTWIGDIIPNATCSIKFDF